MFMYKWMHVCFNRTRVSKKRYNLLMPTLSPMPQKYNVERMWFDVWLPSVKKVIRSTLYGGGGGGADLSYFASAEPVKEIIPFFGQGCWL